MSFDLSKRNHKTVFSFLSKGQFYEPDVSLFLLRAIEPGDSAIDVGANQGYFSLFLSSLVGSNGRVLACEPDSANQDDILENLRLNQFRNVHVIPNALSSEPEERNFYENHIDSGGHALWDITEFPGNEREEGPIAIKRVKTITLEQVIHDYFKECGRLRLIKIDTEGAEEIILRGGLKALAHAEVPFVITELHEFGLRKLGSSQGSLREMMGALGYECFVLGLKGGLPYFVPPGVAIKSRFIVNLCFAIPGAMKELFSTATFDPLSF